MGFGIPTASCLFIPCYLIVYIYFLRGGFGTLVNAKKRAEHQDNQVFALDVETLKKRYNDLGKIKVRTMIMVRQISDFRASVTLDAEGNQPSSAPLT